ncbi:DUF3100 domain-containing protein [Sinomonas sp. JGH33]|uniref:DUF3100 domain-containing protein n=1 Tax=Sinomonas terricola TaxID=3110330 RepID=A0ABU5T675_9MICC|nr:DUF3100 domain-containing protein [Sinomonas sp. JGH33]MEA5455149.1 DUF3100 domain-containing protein [Sinomonas sp. JGH33]
MTATPSPTAVGRRTTAPLAVLALAIAIVAQLIGQFKINVGIGTLVIFPMVWGLLIALVASVQKIRPVPVAVQRAAAALSGVAVLLLVARLSVDIGPSIPQLFKAGPALLLQEAGHMLGTIVLALPVAVLLRMGRATVGATFSLDREPAFAMVSTRFGANSDEYRGVLAMYVFGTIFGAVYISLLTSLIANWKIFDPLALAMGAGVGSGSMMAASVASIIGAYPASASAITGMAAVSNLITGLIGTYVGMYIALPLADRVYRLLTRTPKPVLSPIAVGAVSSGSPAETAHDADNAAFRGEAAEAHRVANVPLWVSLPILTVVGLATAFIAKGLSWTPVGGYAIMLAMMLVSFGLARLTRNKVPAVIWIMTIGALLSSPWSPLAKTMAAVVGGVDFLSIATIVLTVAGLSLGKDLHLLRRIGWRIIPVGLVAVTATFLLSSIIAEFALGLWH